MLSVSSLPLLIDRAICSLCLSAFAFSDADLLDHHDDLALGFGQRIADLVVHHVDVGLGVLHVCLDSFAGGQFA